jgi:hypothetical protein
VEIAASNGKPQAWTGAEFMAQDFTGEEDLWYAEVVADYIAKERERCKEVVKEKQTIASSSS